VKGLLEPFGQIEEIVIPGSWKGCFVRFVFRADAINAYKVSPHDFSQLNCRPSTSRTFTRLSGHITSITRPSIRLRRFTLCPRSQLITPPSLLVNSMRRSMRFQSADNSASMGISSVFRWVVEKVGLPLSNMSPVRALRKPSTVG
jgi:hypothetical protein